MQHLVPLHAPHIVAIEQPVELLDAEREVLLIGVARPMGTMAFQTLVPDDKPVTLQISSFNLLPRALMKPNSAPDIGSICITSLATSDRPSICRLMSTRARYKYTRSMPWLSGRSIRAQR